MSRALIHHGGFIALLDDLWGLYERESPAFSTVATQHWQQWPTTQARQGSVLLVSRGCRRRGRPRPAPRHLSSVWVFYEVPRPRAGSLWAEGRRRRHRLHETTLYIFFSVKIHFHLHIIAVPPEYNSLYVNAPVSFHFTYNTRQYGSVRRVGNIKLQREFSFLIMNCYTDIIIKRLGICGRHEK